MHICDSSTDQTPINELLQLSGVKQVSFPKDTRIIDVWWLKYKQVPMCSENWDEIFLDIIQNALPCATIISYSHWISVTLKAYTCIPYFAVAPKQLKDVGKNLDFFLYEISLLVSFQQKQNDYSLNNEVKYIYWTISLKILSFFCGYVFLYIDFVVQFYCSLQNMWYMYI